MASSTTLPAAATTAEIQHRATTSKDALTMGILASQLDSKGEVLKGEQLALPAAAEHGKLEPLLAPVRALLAEHRAPGTLPERYLSTEANVNFLLARTRKAGPVDRAAGLTKLEQQPESLATSHTVLQQNPLLEAEAAAVKVDATRTELAKKKKKKDVPTSASEHKALEEALSTLATAIE